MARSFSITRRLLEILPGGLTWLTLASPFPLSFYYPNLVAMFVIIYDLYWLFRSVGLVTNTIAAYRLMRRDLNINWRSRIDRDLPKTRPGSPNDIYHVVLVVHYKESRELLAQSIRSYVETQYPKQRLWLILASEQRAGHQAIEIFNQLKKEFGGYFSQFIQTIHPDQLPGEIRCKSANATWGGRQIKKMLDRQGIDYRQVIIHNFDADTRVYPMYFDYVTYQYLTTPVNQPTSYQPIHIYSNNIWDVPMVMRIVAQSSTLIFMYNTLRPHRFHHFSSRSDVFQTIVDINYWAVDAIPEDSRQYYDSYFYYSGRLVVQPLYIPLKMDAVLAEGYWRTVQNQYRQLRRWAWGISDFPYVVNRAIADRTIPWWRKLSKIALLLESHFSWATASIIISIVGWIPLIASPNFSNTVFGSNFPIVTRWILTTALVGLVTTIVISYLLLPPRPAHRHKFHYAQFLLQWILTPVVSIFLSSAAAIDAQTRLMFGRYLEYQVTEKKVTSTT